MKTIKKSLSFSLVLVLLCVMNCSSVMAYGNSRPESVAGISVTFSNYISQDLKSTSASTTTGASYVSAYVDAYFYYTDSDNNYSSYYHGVHGNYGAAGTGFVSTDSKLFYRVVSSHSASYGGETCSYSGLVTSITGN